MRPRFSFTLPLLMASLLVVLSQGKSLTRSEEEAGSSSRNRSSSSTGRASGLRRGPQPGLEGHSSTGDEKKPSKRQFYLPPPPAYPSTSGLPPPQYPFLPVYVPYPQVVTVHHVVMLQQPIPFGCPLPPQQQPGGGLPATLLPPTVTTTSPTTTLDDRSGPMGGGTAGGDGRNTTMPRRPSRCVWAIVACCSPDSTNIRYSCFELLGCPGAFWGVNPCEARVVQAAANTALNFYMTGEPGDDLSGNQI